MGKVMIHYENKQLDCEEGLHGPFFFLEDVSKRHPGACKDKSKICINAICLECGKVGDFTMNRTLCKKNVVFQNGEFLQKATTSRVKTFYDTSKRYYELSEEYKEIEEIVEILNKEKKLVK